MANPTKDNLKDSLAVLRSYFCELNSSSLVRQLIPNPSGGFYGWEVRGGAKTDSDLSIRQKLPGSFEKQPAASERQNMSGESDVIGGAFGGKVNSRPRVSAEHGRSRIS
jgi:hypothetical protein